MLNLKQDIIRKEYNFEGNKIIVKNPTLLQKEEIKKMIESSLEINETEQGTNIKIKIDSFEMIKFLFKELVKVLGNKNEEISIFEGMTDEQIKDTIDNPKPLLEEINLEISNIIEEINKSKMTDFLKQIQSLEYDLDQYNALQKIEKLSKKYKIPFKIPTVSVENENSDNIENVVEEVISKSKPKKSRAKKAE